MADLSQRVERIGLDHLVAPLPRLRGLGHTEEADALQQAAQAFCDSLLTLHQAGPGSGPLRDAAGLPVERLCRALFRAADALRLEGDPEGLGSWCVALAARLGAVLDQLDPSETRVLVFVEEHGGTARLVLVALEPVSSTVLTGIESRRTTESAEPDPVLL